MKPKIEVFPSGACVSMEQDFPGGLYTVRLRSPCGFLLEKMRYDDEQDAQEFYDEICEAEAQE